MSPDPTFMNEEVLIERHICSARASAHMRGSRSVIISLSVCVYGRLPGSAGGLDQYLEQH